MKAFRAIAVGLLLCCSCLCAVSQLTDNMMTVKNFPGVTVGAKVAAAMADCNPSTLVPCILVLDPSLAVYAAGTMPTLCAQCVLADYRHGLPSGASSSAGAGSTAGGSAPANYVFLGDSRMIVSGTCAVSTCAYNLVNASAGEPAFSGALGVIDAGIGGGNVAAMVAAYASTVHPYTTAVTHKPSFVFITLSADDFDSGTCPANSDLQAGYASLMTSAHADGATVVLMTAPQSNWNLQTQCSSAYTQFSQMNQWARAQGKSAAGVASGAFFDLLVDAGAVFTNPGSGLYAADSVHLSDAGNSLWASMVNLAVSSSSSVAGSVFACGSVSGVPCLASSNEFEAPQSFVGGSLGLQDVPTAGIPFAQAGNAVGFGLLDRSGQNYSWIYAGNNGNPQVVFWNNRAIIPGQEQFCFNNSGDWSGLDPIWSTPDTCMQRDNSLGGVVDFGNGGWNDSGGGVKGNVFGPVTAPTGACAISGAWSFSQDGHASHCNAGSWEIKI